MILGKRREENKKIQIKNRIFLWKLDEFDSEKVRVSKGKWRLNEVMRQRAAKC